MKRAIIKRLSDSINASVNLGGSKSISNRLLVIKQLSGEEIEIQNLSDSDDSHLLAEQLKIIDACASSRIPLVVDAQNAGTVFRFLTSLLAQKEGKWLLTGSKRMQERPVGPLVQALRQLGAKIDFASTTNYPPLVIHGQALHSKSLVVDSSESSQYISSLMMVGPTLKYGLEITMSGSFVSFPYIRLTSEVMSLCGVQVEIDGNMIRIPPGDYSLPELSVEADWSSASYWYQLAAMGKESSIHLEGLTKNSMQGDRVVADIFQQFGVRTSFTEKGISLSGGHEHQDDLVLELSGHPDLAPAILATAAAKGIRLRLQGISHLRHKESDRIDSLSAELKKTGADIIFKNKVLELVPGKSIPGGDLEFNTHKDHRLAMCLAPFALIFGSVTINEPDVVTKSYPEYWSDLQKTAAFSVDKK